jgi:WD40 repeat protein
MDGGRDGEEAPRANSTDNPLAVGAPDADAVPPSHTTVREVRSAGSLPKGAIFLGADTLVLVHGKGAWLHFLEDENAAAVLVVECPNAMNAFVSSCDGAALCFGDDSGWLGIYDVSTLRVAPLSPPRHKAELRVGIVSAAFSNDGARLLTMCAFRDVEVRDARSAGLPLLRTLAFQGPGNGHGHDGFLHCAGDLAVAVSGGYPDNTAELGADNRRARLWLLHASGEEEVATIEIPAFASAAAVRGDGGQIAVGGTDGAVRLFESDGWAQSAELAEPGDAARVTTLAYTPDGRRLVVGRAVQAMGDFVVYDVGSGAAVGRFMKPNSYGFVATVAPTGDMVAVGGWGAKLVTMRALVPPVSVRRYAMSDATANDALAGAAAAGDTVALAMGSRLEVHSRSGAVPSLALELGAAVGCFVKVNNPVAVRSDGALVACVFGPASMVTCRAVPLGEEVFALGIEDLGEGLIMGLCWSPSGDVLLVNGPFGVAVFDPNGAKLRAIDKQDVAWSSSVVSVAFSTDGARLVTVDGGDKVLILETTDWVVTHELPMGGAYHSPCFDPACECVAAWMIDTSHPAGSVIVHRIDGTAPAQRFPNVNAIGALAFSEDGMFLFYAGCISSPGPVGVLSRTTGTKVNWSSHLVAMALPPGPMVGITLTVPTEGTAGAGGPSHRSRLQIAVGPELVEVDVRRTRYAIEDAAWDFERLVQLADSVEPAVVGALVSNAAYCLNIRAVTTGDTLLHHCVRTRNGALAAACLAPEGALFVPIANAEGKTALHVALELNEASLARALAESLTPDLNDDRAALLTDALAEAARTMPEMVLPLLNAIEPTVLVEQAAMRTLYHRVEVIGLATAMLNPNDRNNTDSETFESEQSGHGLGSAAGFDLAPWNKAFPSVDTHAAHALVAFKALKLAGLAGDPAER